MKILQKSALLRKLSKHLPYSLRVRIKRIAISLGKFQTDSYISWIRECDTLSEQDYRAIDRHIMALEYKPLISVIMPTYETPEWALREAIDSIKGQLYPKWELCVADDASPSLHVEKILRDAAAVDSRIRWMRRERNGNISAASNSAISLATGEFIALMDHDDVLSPRALYEVVVALNKNPRLDVIYSDEDQIDKNGQRHTPYFKTDWNIDLLLSQNMISHLGVYRRSLVEHVGGFREGFEGSQDYDLALRCADATLVDRVHHIPAILYHWRRDFGTASYSERKLEACWDAARRAIAEHLHRCNEKGRVGPHPKRPMWSRVNRMVPEPAPLVSLIVSGRDEHFLERCVSGLLYRTNYPQVELLIADQEGGSFQTH
ncbi:MAG: glycosyltransferase, partial [Chromatiales bacterium]|nr:glycosyltransferase [Chromatiales bacterium]